MITFKQYLREEERDLVKFLRDNCDEAVHDMFKADHYLWRGANKRGRELFKYGDTEYEGYFGFPRDDRKPRNTPGWAHDAINDFFKKEFGEPLRSNSVFAASVRVTAGGYGSSFALIPIGPYKIYWAPKVEDLTTLIFPDLDEDEENEKVMAGGGLHWIHQKIPFSEVTREMQIDYINKLLFHADYREGPNVDALKSRSELMVRCKSYLALSISESDLTKVIQDAAVDEKVEQ